MTPPPSEDQQHALIVKLKEELGEATDEKLQRSGEEGLTEKALRRWLVARKWDYRSVKTDLAAHATWREHNVPHGRIADNEVKDNLHDKKVFIQGVDRLGHPVLCLYVKRHDPKSFESIKRFICYSLDGLIKLGSQIPGWDGKVSGVLYLTGMGMSNFDVTGLRAIFDTLQNHYPERLYRMYLYNASSIFYALWKIVAPFVDPVTRQKVVFVYPKDADKEMLNVISKEILPAEMGGTAPWRPIEEAWGLLLENKLEPFLPPGFTPPASAVVSHPEKDVQHAAAKPAAETAAAHA